MRRAVGLLSFAVALLVAPATAFADSATMFSEAGDYIGGGRQAVFDTRVGDRVSASVSSDGGSLYVSVSGGPYGESYGMSFAAPDATALRPGVYVGAQRAPFREAGRPGIDVSGDGRGCNTISGSFEVRELVAGVDGSVQSAWIVYEQHCEGGTAALFGEVRIGAPQPAVPSLVRWPSRDVGGGGQAVPVIVGGSAPVTGVSVVGEAAGDFVVRVDDCTGAAPPCEVWVRFVPVAPGTRLAWLRVTDAAGGRIDVPLQAFAYGGTTGLTMRSDPGDYIGGGANWSYGPDSTIGVYGSRSFISAGVDGANGDWWYLDFEPPAGDILAPGTYTGATRYPFNGTGAGLSISGEGRGCNELSGSFTVHELELTGGALRSLSVSFEQHCEHMTPALRGTLNFRAGDTTTPAPWMVASGTPVPVGQPGTTPPPPLPPSSAPPGSAPPGSAPPAAETPAPPVAAAVAAKTSLAAERARVAASSRALIKATEKLRPRGVAKARKAAARLAADLKRYRAATADPALLRAIDRQAAAVRELRRALTRYASGRDRAVAAKAVVTAARKLAAADRAAAKASRAVLR